MSGGGDGVSSGKDRTVVGDGGLGMASRAAVMDCRTEGAVIQRNLVNFCRNWIIVGAVDGWSAEEEGVSSFMCVGRVRRVAFATI